MASNPANKSETIIDPIFHIPEGAVDFVYDDKDRFNTPDNSDVGGSGNDGNGPDTFIMDDGNDDTAGVPDVPEVVGVVQQDIDRKPWGQQVIDVLIDVSDVAGDVKYEYRITKV